MSPAPPLQRDLEDRLKGGITFSRIMGLGSEDREAVVERLLAVDVKDNVWPWLTPGILKHLQYGTQAESPTWYGRELQDIEIISAWKKVAQKRAVRLALAVAILGKIGPGAVLKATWADVQLDQERWTIPVSDFKPAPRDPRHKRRGPDPIIQVVPIPRGGRIHDIFIQAREIGHGVELLCDLVPPVRNELSGNGGRVFVPRNTRPQAFEPVFGMLGRDRRYNDYKDPLGKDAIRDFLRKPVKHARYRHL